MLARSIAPALLLLLLGAGCATPTPKAPQQVDPPKPTSNANPRSFAVVTPIAPAAPPVPDLPDEAPLDGYVVTTDRQPSEGAGQLSAEPIELEDGTLLLVSFGRRLEVRGKTAKIVDRRENPQYRSFVAVPASAGGGYLFASKRGIYFAQTFGGTPIALTLPATMAIVDRPLISFGYKTLLIGDLHLLSLTESNPPEGESYVSLTDGKPRNLGVVGVLRLAGTANGRRVILNRDGEILFAESEAEPPHRLGLPRAYDLSVVGGEFVISDQKGAYRLDPTQSDRSQMPPPPASPTSSTSRPLGMRLEALRGRLLDRSTVGALSGTSVALYSLFGNPIGSVDVAKGSKDRDCMWLGSEGPLRFSCRSEQGTSVHLFDPVTKTSKLERAFPGNKKEVLTFVDSPPGQVFARGHCDGSPAGEVVCLQMPDGFREVDLLPALRKAGVVGPGYSRYGSVLAVSEDGRAVMIVGGPKDASFSVVFSDGRARSFPNAKFPRHFRPGLGHDKSVLYIQGDAVYGLLESGAESDVPLRTGGLLRLTTPAISFSLPLSGEPKVEAFTGLIGWAGGRFLRLDASGTGLLLSPDVGRTMVPVAGPPGLAIDPTSVDRDYSGFCADAGCTVGPWIRYGWGKAPQPPVP